MFGNANRDRRQQLLARPFPREWLVFLEQNVSQYRFLADRFQLRLRKLARILAAEKNWVGCGGLKITDEIKITIAGNACLLLLGIDEEDYCFEGVQSILVYPTPYYHPPQMRSGDIVERAAVVYGESWHRGPIVLAWDQVVRKSTKLPLGRNLVVHEFAHHLDGLDGNVDGTPPLATRQQYDRWRQVAEREYLRLRQHSRRGRASLLDEYGATNRPEFFAVATECFFEQPAALKEESPDLYGILRDCYRQDPAVWYQGAPAPEVTSEENAPAVYRQAVDDSIRAMRLEPDTADAHFARGVLHLNARQHEMAAASFSEAIRLDPEDSEALVHRGEAYLELSRLREALADAERALDISADELAAYRVRGRAELGLRDFDAARTDFDRLLAENSQDPRTWYDRGRAEAGLGDDQTAVKNFTRALRNDPNFSEAYLARAEALERLGQDEQAAADRAEAERRDPTLGEGNK